ncbi:MAG TPA: nucleotidyl transferase AbiEii/AbiGii toxin family protein [Prolixibacteraceae bacterium]|jgi:predicted nucleotidyltransferase component of viral defense system|nr:nucleotidyl transferase AbiEii/AbiGii toxin family protein [Prolixibacteraceae bacterium]HQE52428.1 nucleotidyl transferase AbiEii/AbiGii toxin family protein [Prolixibacteraceae bacterium]HQH75038.1 nucleotidyl transferase AbiEii/AbiGii toxin family protein [Prolixibacteraceae bacterium]HQJ84671.1 nucleotidyl transferase AbiEii/AbiGii toxin family protein [Prolixibacteraceae bacterium]
MKGLSLQTEKLLISLSELPFIREYTLIGGSALALQIGHRLSEDLDFCIWSKNLKKDKPTVDWPLIEKELQPVGKITSRDVLGFDQVNFIVNNVKLTFLAKQHHLSPLKTPVHLLNHICCADVEAIGAMKLELILRRSEFRDYYDIYSILKEAWSLKKLVLMASKYSRHLLKTRDVLSFLSNGDNFRKDARFSLLHPVYDVDHRDIAAFIREIIFEEYGS